MDLKGWVYVISNPAMPDLVKVGFSLKDPQLRASELDGTGIAHPFEVEYEGLVQNPRAVEQLAHALLSDVHERKEWFRCSPTFAVQAIRDAAGAEIIIENVYIIGISDSSSSISFLDIEDIDELIKFDDRLTPWDRRHYYSEHVLAWVISGCLQTLDEAISHTHRILNRTRDDDQYLYDFMRLATKLRLISRELSIGSPTR